MGALGGLSLAVASGWNTFLPLLLIALAGRIDDDFLVRPYDVLSSLGGILTLLALLTVEIVVDKIPRADLVNDILGSALRPASGALCCMALASTDDSLHPVLALGAGLLIGGAVHWWRCGWRRVVEVESRGVATPLASMVGDLLAALVSVAGLLYGPAGLAAVALAFPLLRSSYSLLRRFGAPRAPSVVPSPGAEGLGVRASPPTSAESSPLLGERGRG